MPVWTEAWCDPSSETFIFTAYQRRIYIVDHLRENCWYVECPRTFCPPEEVALRQRLSGGSTAFGAAAEASEGTDSATAAVAEDDAAPKPKTRKEILAEAARARRAVKKQEKLNARAAKARAAADAGPVASAADTEIGVRHSQPESSTPNSALRSQSTFTSNPALSQPVVTIVPESQPAVSSKPEELVINAAVSVDLYDRVGAFAKGCNHGLRCTASGKDRRKGKRVDLVIADVPDGLTVPEASPSAVPEWNILGRSFLRDLFNFADSFLHDDGAMFLVYSDDGQVMRGEIESYFPAFGFMELKTWTGFNRLHMTSARPGSSKTQLFKVLLVVRATKTHPSSIPKPCQSKFQLRTDASLKSIGVDLVEGDAILNFTNPMAMNGDVAWRGAKEKDSTFLSSLILSATAVNDIVVDVTAATGKYSLSFSSIIHCIMDMLLSKVTYST